jgi:hypothetical protein
MDKPAADKGKKHFSERILELTRKSHLETLSPRRYKIAEAVKARLEDSSKRSVKMKSQTGKSQAPLKTLSSEEFLAQARKSHLASRSPQRFKFAEKLKAKLEK